MEADAISTTIMVLGPDKGFQWAVHNGIAAMLIIRLADGFAITHTPSFATIKEWGQSKEKQAAHSDRMLAVRTEPKGLTLCQAVVLGAVEGATEYLPVSSTGHLVIVQRALGLGTDADIEAASALAICIQSGAILAVLVLYCSRFRQMFRGLCGGDSDGKRLVSHLLIAFAPAAIVGFFFHKWIKQHLFGVGPVAGALLVGGVLILATANSLLRRGGHEGGKELHELTCRDALFVGLTQCLAFWPGFSRSLATILGCAWTGLRLSAAVEFSFLLGFVTLSAATAFEGMQHGSAIVAQYGVIAPFIAFFVAFLSAVVSIRFMIRVLSSHGLAPFGYYRIALASVCVLLF
jgi:undecaprenyl-diphosphatase